MTPEASASSTRAARATRAARRLDRRVYRSHPWVYLASVALARVPVLRLGRTVVVNDADLVREALTAVRLDRVGAGTTGGSIQAQLNAAALFNEDGDAHRRSRRRVASALSGPRVEALRPVWTRHLDGAVLELAQGRELDVVRLVRLVAGDTTRALLGVEADALQLCAAATAVAARAAAGHLRIAARPVARAARPRTASQDVDAGALLELLRPSGTGLLADLSADGLTTDEVLAVGATVAVAAVNTTLASIPRAVALAARADSWSGVIDCGATVLAGELLRVTAPTPVLPRASAERARLGRVLVEPEDRLLLLVRNALRRGAPTPDPRRPAPERLVQLAFGAGAHACPGAQLARAQLADTLTALAPLRPTIVRSIPATARDVALPGWADLVVRAGDGAVASQRDPRPTRIAR